MASRITSSIRAHAFSSETVPGSEDAACGGPGSSANNPTTDPTNLEAPSGDVASYTGAQNLSLGGTDYIDQYVAKHNPVPWFEALTGQVNTDGSIHAATQRACQRRHELRLEPRRQPRRPERRPRR